MSYEIKYISKYIDFLQSRGQYIFQKIEALKALKCSDNAFRSSVKRFVQNQRIARLTQGFYLIIPIEHRNMNALPPEWYIDTLMQHLGIPYYVGLLTAASYHGAAHQAPQTYQVITDRQFRSFQVGRSKIQFYKNSFLSDAKTKTLKVPTGNLRFSTSEQTAFDLVKYIQASGGINRIATILSELQESMAPDKLVEIAKLGMSLACAQRLGYILETIGSEELIMPLKKWLNEKKPQYILLKPSKEHVSLKKNEEWKLIINDQIETDL